jgi:SAM-dependent methyltransferase
MPSSSIHYFAQPPTSFPHRDLLVLERMRPSGEDEVCEVGVGTGGTAVRLSRLCRSVVGIDVSEPTISHLRYLERLHGNLRLVTADVTRPDQIAALSASFTKVVSCDTLEHVGDAEGYFRGVVSLLAPGGKLLVTFPNESPERMHGVTRFDGPEQILALLSSAGAVGCRIGSASLTPYAARLAERLGWGPLRAVKRVLRSLRHERPLSPQTFEETSFYRRRRLWQSLAPLVNLYWYFLLRGMSANGPAFGVDWGITGGAFQNCQVVVEAENGR